MINILKSRLFLKLFLLIFLAIFLIIFTGSFQTINYQKQTILESLSSKSKMISDSVSFVKRDSMIIDNEIDLLEFILEFVKTNKEIKHFLLVRNNGNILSIKQNNWQLIQTNENYYQNYQNKETNYQIIKSPYLKEDIFKFSYPVNISGVLWGWFHLEIDSSEYNLKVNDMYNNIFFLSIVLLLSSIFLSYLITTMVALPIIKLSETSQKISKGNISLRVNLNNRSDEIGILSKSFNDMVDSIEKSQIDLKKSRDDLERRVEERTVELKELNNSLQEKSKELKELNENLENRVMNEISKRQRQQQLLIQQSKLAAMGEMIGNIAHQWRQPLNALSLVLQNIDFNYKLGELDDEFMDKSIKKANLLTTNMSKTIDDFRNFFKPNKEKKVFSLQESINKAISLIDATLNNNNIKLDYHRGDEILIYGFMNEFSQVILNIINNAKDALNEKKVENATIKIEIKKEESNVLIIIEDNAGGISKDIIDKIYDPYFTTKEEGKGTGIGLYMSKVIIEENMGGKIIAENINAGARFTISIPDNEVSNG